VTVSAASKLSEEDRRRESLRGPTLSFALIVSPDDYGRDTVARKDYSRPHPLQISGNKERMTVSMSTIDRPAGLGSSRLSRNSRAERAVLRAELRKKCLASGRGRLQTFSFFYTRLTPRKKNRRIEEVDTLLSRTFSVDRRLGPFEIASTRSLTGGESRDGKGVSYILYWCTRSA